MSISLLPAAATQAINSLTSQIPINLGGNDPRSNLATKCINTQKRSNSLTTEKKGFFEALGNVGNLEFLNDIGGSEIGEGLRVLTSVSDSIRVGSSVVPGREGDDLFGSTLGKIVNTAFDAVEEGANIVMDTVGLGGAVDAVAGIDPGVANRAYGQGKAIYEKVKQGNFDLRDIPETFSDLQNLERLVTGIFTEPTDRPLPSVQLCDASPYATDLISYAPKFKFLFVVEIHFAPAYSEWSRLGTGVSFVIKNSSRPNIEFEYEDVNMYNYWTKIPKKMNYQPMTMRFYDDNQNNATQFYAAYLRAMSPISNLTFPQLIDQHKTFQESSMNYQTKVNNTFGGADPYTNSYGSNLGPLNQNTVSLIRQINLYHIFDYGRLMNVYHFNQPKILSLEPDELDMADNGNGSEMAFQFAYDSMSVEHATNVDEFGMARMGTISGGSNGARYTLQPIMEDNTTVKKGTKHAPSTKQADSEEGFFGGITGGLTDAANAIYHTADEVLQTGETLISDAYTAGSDFVGSIFS